MQQFTPNVVSDELFDAMDDLNARSFLHRQTGQVVRFYPGGRGETDAAQQARRTLNDQAADWVPIPTEDYDCVVLKQVLVSYECLPNFV